MYEMFLVNLYISYVNSENRYFLKVDIMFTKRQQTFSEKGQIVNILSLRAIRSLSQQLFNSVTKRATCKQMGLAVFQQNVIYKSKQQAKLGLWSIV